MLALIAALSICWYRRRRRTLSTSVLSPFEPVVGPSLSQVTDIDSRSARSGWIGGTWADTEEKLHPTLLSHRMISEMVDASAGGGTHRQRQILSFARSSSSSRQPLIDGTAAISPEGFPVARLQMLGSDLSNGTTLVSLPISVRANMIARTDGGSSSTSQASRRASHGSERAWSTGETQGLRNAQRPISHSSVTAAGARALAVDSRLLPLSPQVSDGSAQAMAMSASTGPLSTSDSVSPSSVIPVPVLVLGPTPPSLSAPSLTLTSRHHIAPGGHVASARSPVVQRIIPSPVEGNDQADNCVQREEDSDTQSESPPPSYRESNAELPLLFRGCSGYSQC